MQTARKVRALGVGLLLAAIPAFVYVAEPLGGMLAFALAVTGVFVAVVVAEEAVPARSVEEIVDGDADVLAELARGFELEGRPVYVPDQGNVGGERLFLAASDNDRRTPILDPDTVAYAGSGGTKVGLALDPPGQGLIGLHERETRPLPEGVGLSEAEAFLAGLFATHDLVGGVTVTKPDEHLRVRFTPGALELPCQDAPVDPTCERSGCVVCQAAGCTLARSMQRPLAVAEAHVEQDHVMLHLRPEDLDGDQGKPEEPEDPAGEEGRPSA